MPQGEALFDLGVADTDAALYVSHSVSAVLAAAEEENCKYLLSFIDLCHVPFTS